VTIVALFTFPGFAAAQYAAVAPPEHAVYPSGGQSAEQQQTDQAACQSWATQQSGVDLNRLQPPPSGETPEGGVLRGGARGALVGVTVGAIAGDAGKGAAIGAASGGLLGGMRRRDQAGGQQQEQQQWEQQASQQTSTWDRFYVTCMQGRNYSVN
jgi:hypothetical protein